MSEDKPKIHYCWVCDVEEVCKKNKCDFREQHQAHGYCMAQVRVWHKFYKKWEKTTKLYCKFCNFECRKSTVLFWHCVQCHIEELGALDE